jgi:hypothetical protein
MHFQFVENDKIDARSRKLIRSHVMKGKNAGKTRRRPTSEEDKQQDDRASSACPGAVVALSTKRVLFDGGPKSIERPLGDELSYFTFPCPASSESISILQQCV